MFDLLASKLEEAQAYADGLVVNLDVINMDRYRRDQADTRKSLPTTISHLTHDPRPTTAVYKLGFQRDLGLRAVVSCLITLHQLVPRKSPRLPFWEVQREDLDPLASPSHVLVARLGEL